jgi:hypothetical protein
MKRSRFAEEQIMGMLCESEALAKTAESAQARRQLVRRSTTGREVLRSQRGTQRVQVLEDKDCEAEEPGCRGSPRERDVNEIATKW